MLEVRNLASGYQKIPIILGVNFEVADGEFVGILGHNGMGKTTLLKTVVGQLPATAGSIRFGGAEIARAALAWATCRKAARSFPGSRCSTICAWARPAPAWTTTYWTPSSTRCRG